MNKKSLVFSVIALVFIFTSYSFAGEDNTKSYGILLGDPLAVTMTIPVKEDTFLNIHAGIWSWKFWHGIQYDTPFASVDYAWRSPVKKFPPLSYIGIGIAGFFKDNPKDDNNYSACAAVRLPIGIYFYNHEKYTVGFEIAPIYQFLPAYSSGPYGLELNGGLTVMFK